MILVIGQRYNEAMAHHLHRFMASLLALAALLQANEALEFDVFNKVPSTLGGVQFDKEIGIPFKIRMELVGGK
ncbi:hypothetical protein ACSBR1_019741 [Camellia fascicularis]